jgi:hypothetical protein
MANRLVRCFQKSDGSRGFEAAKVIEMKKRGYSIRARSNKSLINRPDIWEQLRSLTAVIEKKRLAKKRSPYIGPEIRTVF